MTEKCHKGDINENGYYSCRLNKGHKGKHKWWTSIGNALNHSWDQQPEE